MTSEPSPTQPTSAAPGVTDYRQRAVEFQLTAQRYSQHTGKLVLARGLTFLAAAACFLLALLDPNARPVLIAAGTVMLLVFLAVAILDDWLKRQSDHYQQLRQVNLWQQARVDRQWNAFPVPEVEVPAEYAAVAKDLDLFGHASLFQLLCLARTPRGMAMLRDWLLEPAERAEIVQRQQAVRELAGELELREEAVLRGHLLAQGLAGPEAFIRWAESPPLLAQHPWMKWFSRLVPAVGLLVLMALGAAWLPANAGATLLIVVLLLNVLFSVLFTGRVHDIFDNISTRNGELRHYLALFELFDSIPARTQRLANLRRTVVDEDGGTLRHLQRLNWIMKLAAVRHDPLLSVLYFAFQATMLWDFHALWILERWQQRCGHHVRSWFDALAELEAVFSLAGLAYDHPAWGYAKITQQVGGQVVCQGIGHPLLSNAVRVSNDVTVGPAGTVLLVTGSNMSGKSTLLRSIGLNRHAGRGGWTGVRHLDAIATADGHHQHADPGFAGGRRLVLHGRTEATQGHCRSSHAVPTARVPHPVVPAGRDSAGN